MCVKLLSLFAFTSVKSDFSCTISVCPHNRFYFHGSPVQFLRPCHQSEMFFCQHKKNHSLNLSVKISILNKLSLSAF